jgi:hypothetical protein
LPDVRAKILDFGFEPLGDTTEPFAAFVNTQAERWAAAAKEPGSNLSSVSSSQSG